MTGCQPFWIVRAVLPKTAKNTNTDDTTRMSLQASERISSRVFVPVFTGDSFNYYVSLS